MAQISLIANSGIQFYRTSVSYKDLEASSDKMFFSEWLDLKETKRKWELVKKFDDIYASRQDLENKMVAGINSNTGKPWTWQEIQEKGLTIITHNEDEIIKCSFNDLIKPQNGNDSFLSKILNKWLPIPYFEYTNQKWFQKGPYNWARLKITTDENDILKYNVIIAFDTKTKYASVVADNEYNEIPVFASDYERQKTFGYCCEDKKMFDFCSPDSQSNWVNSYIMNIVEGTVNLASIRGKYKYKHLSYYIYFLTLLGSKVEFPDVVLFKDCGKGVECQNVSLVVDVGNSKTTALLYENDFTKTRMLRLNNFSLPTKYSEEPFDMQIAFQKADFGDMLENSQQFIYPSFIRLGEEAKYLIYNSKNKNLTKEVLTTCSSPKRYLWDDKKRKHEWEYISLVDNSTVNGMNDNPIWIKGISEQLNGDGSLNNVNDILGSHEKCYSRKSLMTFAFLEILSQARMQINSFEYRDNAGALSNPRKISKIIVTCPTAMSRCEQIALREAAENAYVLLYRFIHPECKGKTDTKEILSNVEILPNVKNLKNTDERIEWLYDEPTCAQFVFIAAEICERYKNRCQEYFDVYGKKRLDLPGYDKKSLTVASLDIGAGTTDLMICAYKYDSSEFTRLTPVPLFWESFYKAGDDMLRDFVQRIIIEGPYAIVESKLRQMGVSDVEIKIANFYGQDTANMSFHDREIRKDFNLQISVPVAQKFMEESRKQTKKAEFRWKDFFSDLNMPSEHLLDAFSKHFGFRIEDQVWKFDSEIVDKIINDSFEDLLKKISSIISAYSCDMVLLSGRPTTLKQIEKIFLQYYPVSPNRLKVLNDYRVGTWYPFQDGNGYFKNQKSIVAVGALIGYQASKLGQYKGMSLDLSEMIEKVLPTTNYFGRYDETTRDITYIMSPSKNMNKVFVQLPYRIICQQVESKYYPCRDFYMLDFDEYAIENAIKTKVPNISDTDLSSRVNDEIQKIKSKYPLTIEITRDFNQDKETLILEDVMNCDGDSLPLRYFSFQINSLGENDDFWMDSGAFKTSIKTR